MSRVLENSTLTIVFLCMTVTLWPFHSPCSFGNVEIISQSLLDNHRPYVWKLLEYFPIHFIVWSIPFSLRIRWPTVRARWRIIPLSASAITRVRFSTSQILDKDGLWFRAHSIDSALPERLIYRGEWGHDMRDSPRPWTRSNSHRDVHHVIFWVWSIKIEKAGHRSVSRRWGWWFS